MLGLAAAYFTDHWNFGPARVPGRDGTLPRTRRGMFTTREVDRDENRIRGAQVSQPILWLWTGTCDTRVITTGLSMYALSQPADILPRGPVRAARQVVDRVPGAEANPVEAALTVHPRAALRRRLAWAATGAATPLSTSTGTRPWRSPSGPLRACSTRSSRSGARRAPSAGGGIRTPTVFPPTGPKPAAYTCFATPARPREGGAFSLAVRVFRPISTCPPRRARTARRRGVRGA